MRGQISIFIGSQLLANVEQRSQGKAGDHDNGVDFNGEVRRQGYQFLSSRRDTDTSLGKESQITFLGILNAGFDLYIEPAETAATLAVSVRKVSLC